MKPILSELCTSSVVKANTGRNTSLRLSEKRKFLFPNNWTVNDKINYKSLHAIPFDLYTQYELHNTIKSPTIKLARLL